MVDTAGFCFVGYSGVDTFSGDRVHPAEYSRDDQPTAVHELFVVSLENPQLPSDAQPIPNHLGHIDAWDNLPAVRVARAMSGGCV